MFPIRDHNPSQTQPIVTWVLMGLNIFIFLATASQPEQQLAQIYFSFGIIPAQVSGGSDLSTLVTSMFLHGGLMHLAGNMLFLWIFGDNIEDMLGHVGFLIFYLVSGVGAGLAQVAVAPLSGIPVIGASGAIAGVMGGYLLLYPRARVDVLIFIVFFIRVITVPAWAMLGLWFGLQLLNGAGDSSEGGGVAYWAHAGGFAIGAALCLPIWLRGGGGGFWKANAGKPPHPDAPFRPSPFPRVRRKSRTRNRGPWEN